eukprot:TRINITY_DN265_c0_g1_i3.p1 TRINITY_DN265_c0_g1~~TRINITY_DN265_c0_g1_i3.p1  ORF type:complete len:222 (-),score=39.88 TRINITY_DN265_c0_g1_i3:72-737(-)
MQIHWPNRDVPVKETLNALEELRKQGKIKAIGVSNFGVLDTEDATSVGVSIATNQLPYSLLTRSIEYEILDACKKHNIGVLAYSPLAQGLLTGRYMKLEDALQNPGLCRSRFFDKSRSPKCRHNESGCEKELFEAINGISEVAKKVGAPMNHVAIAWAIQQPQVTSVIVGASKPDQIVDNVKASNLKLSKEVIESLNKITEPVKNCLGKNPDLWALETRYR